jgi:hypothetical protein
MKLQKRLLDELKKYDCLSFSNNATGFGMRGIPDITIISHIGVIYAEVKDKTTRDRLSELQKHRIRQIHDYGVPVFIIRTPKDIKELIDNLELAVKN